MDKRHLPKTEEHKKKIGLANKGNHLNATTAGKIVLKDGKKLCTVCKEWKSLSDFDKRIDRPIGIRSKCRGCSHLQRCSDQQAYRYTQYKSGAKRRGIGFDLSKEEFLIFWRKPCFYCGDEIQTIGLDRIDSDKGYSLDNIVSCCAICNTMKLALPRDIFIEHCRKIISNQSAG